VGQLDRRLQRLVEHLHAVVLLQRGGHPAHHQEGLLLGRLLHLHHLERAGERRILLDVLLVLGPGGGGHRAQGPAGQGRLEQVGRVPVPAAPPAPIRVWASSMKRMIGLGDDCTSSITWRSRFSNSPFMLAPGLQEADVRASAG
jgi:hypothetical protein